MNGIVKAEKTVVAKTMTVKEVASALGVSADTIKNCIRRILPNKMQNGKTTYLNESEAALIKKDLFNNTNVQQQINDNGKFMTIRNVADSLDVSYSSVYRAVCKLFPDKTKNGKLSMLNEIEVSQISRELKTDYHTAQLTFSPAEKVKNTTTDLEILENYKKANADLSMLTEKTMTTKELSDVLNVDVSTITKTVKRLNETSEVLPKFKQGQTPRFTEKQATIIKNEIAKHHNLESRQIDNVSTDYEMELMTQKVLAYHIQKANEYKQRAEIAEKSLNRIADGKGCFSMNQAAKALKLPYGNITLYKKLRAESILNSDNMPKQEQVNSGNFKVIVKFVNDKVGNRPVTLVTSKGLVHLARKLDTVIDETVQPDF